MHGVEDQHIAIASQATIPKQVARIRQREKRLAGGQRRVVCVSYLRLRCEIERVAHVFEPAQAVRRQRLGHLERSLRGVAIHCVHRETVCAGYKCKHCLDPREILRERPTANLDLDVGVSLIEKLPNFVHQTADVVRRKVVATSCVRRHGGALKAPSDAAGKKAAA